MGQSPSSMGSKSGRTRRSLRSFTRRSKLNKSNLSHTFSMPTSDEYPELMNVNTATEEQLMTLPGVNRQLAQDIVRHRQMIGRFKRVDDLALVSGIGAEKLEKLRPEICTNSRKALSRASSCTQSLDSVRMSLDSRLCSVNSASVFQLQCIPGLNQELAANIVDYRNKKGPFKSLDDLIKVRGMDVMRVGTVKPYLSLEPRKCESVQALNGNRTNGWSTNLSLNGSVPNGLSHPRTPHRKSLSLSIPTKVPMTLPNGFATAPINDILDLLAAYSHRPIIEEDFNFERDGVRCCRLASWNLHQLSIDKINNPGVREVVCRTILENKLSLLAIQDVLDEVALRILCDELNSPVLRRVREWRRNSHRWDYCIAENECSQKLGFVYDSCNKGICIERLSLEEIVVEDVDNKHKMAERISKLHRENVGCYAQAQAFLVCDKPLLIVNIQCEKRLAGGSVELLQELFMLAEKIGLQMCVMGDFYDLHNVLSLSNALPLIEEATAGEPCGRAAILRGGGDGIDVRGDGLDVRGDGSDVRGDGSDVRGDGFNGRVGCVRGGLRHLAIPRGWAWGGPASPHCPLWAELRRPD